jgi:hypothetical protein
MVALRTGSSRAELSACDVVGGTAGNSGFARAALPVRGPSEPRDWSVTYRVGGFASRLLVDLPPCDHKRNQFEADSFLF